MASFVPVVAERKTAARPALKCHHSRGLAHASIQLMAEPTSFRTMIVVARHHAVVAFATTMKMTDLWFVHRPTMTSIGVSVAQPRFILVPQR